jgi:phospholipid/cholesterol/gamma-HCH transport system permease protein
MLPALAVPVSGGDAGASPASVPTGPAGGPPAGSAPARKRLHRPGWDTQLGLRATAWLADGRCTLEFLGEVLAALGRLVRGRSIMRRSDLFWQLEQTGPRSLPIVSLTCFLVGLILAYMGAAQLQRFGAQIYIADLVTVGVVREIAALMTGVILSGRIGAAFAAQLGSMQANEEIDALKAMGVPPMDFLVLPRLLAMLLVAPLLTAYAAVVGMVAGLMVAVGIFGVQPLEYLHQSLSAMSLTHMNIGLLKGTVYAALVALAGCRQGLYAGRSAQAVGEATTAAVVQALVWIVVAASALTICFQRLDW